MLESLWGQAQNKEIFFLIFKTPQIRIWTLAIKTNSQSRQPSNYKGFFGFLWLLFSNFVSVIATKAAHSTIKRRNVKEIKIVTDLVPSHIIIRKSEFTVDDLDTASQVIDCKSSTPQDKT